MNATHLGVVGPTAFIFGQMIVDDHISLIILCEHNFSDVFGPIGRPTERGGVSWGGAPRPMSSAGFTIT